MHAAVVKLDALPDAVRAPAQNHHLALVRTADFVVAPVVGRVVVRSIGLELGGTGIDQPITRNEVEPLALGTDFVLGASGQMSNLAVGETQRFGFG